jgi:hypothetical protein
MANTIQIKRSVTTATPSALAEGELAYSENSGNLFIGTSGSTIQKIGGNTDVTKLAGIAAGAQVNTVTSVAGKTGAVTIAKADLTNFTETDYVHVTGTETIAGAKTFSNDVVFSGNLTVNGTTTTVSSTNLAITDNIIDLNKDVTGTPALDAGLQVVRGTSANAQLLWNESTDKWSSKLVGGSAIAFSLEGHTHASTDITDFSTAADARIAAASIDALSDVVITTPANNQVLKYDGTSGTWINAAHSSAATTFIALTDAPSAYTGAANYFVKVNTAGTGLEFIVNPGYLTSSATIDGGAF